MKRLQFFVNAAIVELLGIALIALAISGGSESDNLERGGSAPLFLSGHLVRKESGAEPPHSKKSLSSWSIPNFGVRNWRSASLRVDY